MMDIIRNADRIDTNTSGRVFTAHGFDRCVCIDHTVCKDETTFSKHITEVVRTKRTKDLLVNKLMGAGGRRM